MDDSRLKGKKVLIVDDEPDVLSSLEELLPMCTLVKASDFEQAKAQLETDFFDIAILDIMGVDGYKLLDLAISKNVISVMLTAHALTPEHTAASFKKGAAFFVPKEQMGEIALFLNDVLEAKEKGNQLWSRWLERFDAYYTYKFGAKWKENDPEFWKHFDYFT